MRRAQLCLTFCDPMDCSPPGSSVLGISQARVLEWVAISSSRGSSWPGIEPMSPALASRFFTTEPPGKSLKHGNVHLSFSSVQSCPTLCDPMNHSTTGLPVHHQLPEVTQTHVHRVSDAIQPSLPLSSPYPPDPNASQHQNLFYWVNCSHEVAKVVEFQLQHHSLQRNPRAGLLQNGLVGSPCSPRDSQDSSPSPQFKSINSLVLHLLHRWKDSWLSVGKPVKFD